MLRPFSTLVEGASLLDEREFDVKRMFTGYKNKLRLCLPYVCM